MIIFDTKKFFATTLLVTMIGMQVFTISYALLIPKQADAFLGIGDFSFDTIVSNIYDVLKDAGLAALREVAARYADQFLTRFIEKVQDKYKIRNYLYYDQVLSDYYLLNFINDKVSDPNLREIYNLLYDGYITGNDTGFNGQPNPNNALLVKLKQKINEEYLAEAGIPSDYIDNPPADASPLDYYSTAYSYYLNNPGFVQQNLFAQYGGYQTSANTAAQLEVLVGNGLKSGRIIGGTCSLGFNADESNKDIALGPISSTLNSLGLLNLARAQTPLPSTSIQTPTTTAPNAGPSDNITSPITPSQCQARGGTWQPSALDQARAFIDNPAGVVDSWVSAAIDTLTGTAFDPNNFAAAIGSLFGDYIFNKLNLTNTGNVLSEYPNSYTASNSNATVGSSTGIDLDGDGIIDGYDINGDGQPDICVYGGVDKNSPGPPCKPSSQAYNDTSANYNNNVDLNNVTITTGGGSAGGNSLTCSPSTQSVSLGQVATFTASGGDGSYTWSQSEATPSGGTGSTYSASWSAPGTLTVLLTDGTSATATCQVTVQ